MLPPDRGRDAKLVAARNPLVNIYRRCKLVLKSVDQSRDAVVQRRIECTKSNAHCHFLEEVATGLAGLGEVEDWMVLGLLDSAVEEWDKQVHSFCVEYDRIAAQHARRETELQRGGDSIPL
jgi:hypothetical protein